VKSQKPGLDPWPLATHTRQVVTQHKKRENQPVECPFDGREEDGCLEQMLEDHSRPMILDPASADRFCEWHANSGAQDKRGIAKRQSAGVPREQGGKSQIERCALSLYASNVRPQRPYKDRNPKEREESLIRLIAQMVSVMARIHG
jgi:hypothetical protein